MNLAKGQTVYLHGHPGVVLRKIGPHAIKVRTSRDKTDQDFITHKVTTTTQTVAETWPSAKITETNSVTSC